MNSEPGATESKNIIYNKRKSEFHNEKWNEYLEELRMDYKKKKGSDERWLEYLEKMKNFPPLINSNWGKYIKELIIEYMINEINRLITIKS